MIRIFSILLEEFPKHVANQYNAGSESSGQINISVFLLKVFVENCSIYAHLNSKLIQNVNLVQKNCLFSKLQSYNALVRQIGRLYRYLKNYNEY